MINVTLIKELYKSCAAKHNGIHDFRVFQYVYKPGGGHDQENQVHGRVEGCYPHSGQ